MSFTTITLCGASQRVFVVVSVYFVMTQSGNFWIHPCTCSLWRFALCNALISDVSCCDKIKWMLYFSDTSLYRSAKQAGTHISTRPKRVNAEVWRSLSVPKRLRPVLDPPQRPHADKNISFLVLRIFLMCLFKIYFRKQDREFIWAWAHHLQQRKMVVGVTLCPLPASLLKD